MTSSDSAVVAHKVSHTYGRAPALDQVSFEIPGGTFFGLLGPNGSGKTTLFRLLASLLPVQSGTLTVGGHSVATNPAEVRRLLGVTFQSPAVDPRLTVTENLKCHGQIYGLGGAALKQRTNMLLDRFELSDRSRALVGSLSGGLRRRVELAKGLLHSPRVLLLDEPSTGLDPAARRQFWDLIRSQRQEEGTTVVVTTHLMEEAEQCERLVLLDSGRVVCEGPPAELQASLDGQRLSVRCHNTESTQAGIEQLLQAKARATGDSLQFRVPDAAGALKQVMDELGADVISAAVSQPSLEDVFLERTGRGLQQEEEA